MATGLKIAFALLIVVPFGRAQIMSPTEYSGFLKRLDADATRWQKHVSTLRVESIPVSYAEGKFIKSTQDDASRNIDEIRRLIGKELVRARLSTEIEIADRLVSAFLEISNLNGWAFRLAPDSTEHWRDETTTDSGDLTVYKLDLIKHITATADELQNKAEKCNP